MLGVARGSGLNHRQRWWREKRPLQIEEQACALIRRYEGMHGMIPGIVMPPALLVPEVRCELVYFAAEERSNYGVPDNAIGALDTEKLLVLIHDAIETPGREAHTIGEEIGHAVLHAKLVPPEQQGLGLEMPAHPGPRRYHRTEGSAFQDGQGEPAWMTAEAGYFPACLMMPRDRWGEAARIRLEQAVRAGLRCGNRFPPADQRLAEASEFLRAAEEAGYDPAQCNVVMPTLSESHVLEMALDALNMQHNRQVSRAAQTRRLMELGLVHDLADQLLGPSGEGILSRGQFLFVADHVVESARSSTSDRPAEAGPAGSGVGV
jgi:hypothetical protein